MDERAPRTYRIGIDTGGTFVDGVVVSSDGSLAFAKALASEDLNEVTVLEALATALGVQSADLAARTSSVTYGTTVALNALLTQTGQKTGLLTTRGHEDAILIGRVHQKVAGLGPRDMTDVARLAKPPAIVPRWLIHGINERIDATGRELVRLDRNGVRTAARQLVEEGCAAIAISFLWSFKSDGHEREAAALISAEFPGVHVALSVDVAPVLGEYERTAATVVSAYVATAAGQHIAGLQDDLTRMGFAGEFYVMQSNGGFATAAEAVKAPIVTMGSGPAGGVVASARVAASSEHNFISADMGGTSFDVGLVVDGQPELDQTPIVARLHVAVPAIRVRSIGAGGGSVAWLDDAGGLHVGPRSAGADPGPACYALGGTEPTVTDADLMLGRINSSAHSDPRFKMDTGAAIDTVGKLADRLGVEPLEAAVGIVRVADGQMADLVRKATLERGLDPREFILVAFGGAGPVHAGSVAPDVGVASVIVPRLAAAFSAQGLAMSGWRRLYTASDPIRYPADPSLIRKIFGRLERRAHEDLADSGLPGQLDTLRSIDMRYGRQTHVVRTEIDNGRIDTASLDTAVENFGREYERIFGRGTGYREAGVELVAFGLSATVAAADPVMRQPSPSREPVPTHTRLVYFESWVETPVHRIETLNPGREVYGPAVVDGPATTVVVHPGQQVVSDESGSLSLSWRAS